MASFFRQKPASSNAQDILHQLLTVKPQPTAVAPKDCRGIYGLVDHLGALRYIGSTSSAEETFHKRIHQRHRTGSETGSHYFSRMYNTGRMWRLRNDPATKADGDIAKKLRNAFIAEYCKAVWVPLPDEIDIARLEQEVIALAPRDVIAWNRRGMDAYDEPVDLVDRVIGHLDFRDAELAAIDRQKARFFGTEFIPTTSSSAEKASVPPFPAGPFRFMALDVETANNDRGSICQIGVACVRPDSSIETWVTYVDPQTSRWMFTSIHGITNTMVSGAPTFEQVLPVLEGALSGITVYQHSGFDRSAIRAACAAVDLPEPEWEWQDSVTVARQAWPELKGNGGHGLASLKNHLGLSFDHHDAGEDARAAAEVVLHAEGARIAIVPEIENVEVADDIDATAWENSIGVETTPAKESPASRVVEGSVVGYVTLTQGNINNNHFYLRDVLAAFPEDCIGGSNAAAAAARTVTVVWGGHSPAFTDIDGSKKLFRKRGWVGEFFKRNSARVGDQVKIEIIGSYGCRVSIVKF
ncbi:3'-5' exonuclease [Oricola nitratireducens]|uniref:3'-5' exonuclease n=1 Tax=Oricola nitratireducens TaxID=2775868 RepID=UPI0018679A40|nr:3'-5' exonuclease [Oricola nitratireducens]